MRRPLSDRFLRAFRDSTATGRGLEVIAEDADGFASALVDDPEAVLRAIDAAADRAGGAATVPPAVFATAAVRRDGTVVACDPAFAALALPQEALAEIIRGVRQDAPRLSSIVDDAGGRPVAVVAAPLDRARRWPLAAPVRSALAAAGPATFAVMGWGRHVQSIGRPFSPRGPSAGRSLAWRRPWCD